MRPAQTPHVFGVSKTMKNTKAKYTVNGKEYSSLEEMPPEDRRLYETLMRDLEPLLRDPKGKTQSSRFGFTWFDTPSTHSVSRGHADPLIHARHGSRRDWRKRYFGFYFVPMLAFALLGMFSSFAPEADFIRTALPLVFLPAGLLASIVLILPGMHSRESGELSFYRKAIERVLLMLVVFLFTIQSAIVGIPFLVHQAVAEPYDEVISVVNVLGGGKRCAKIEVNGYPWIFTSAFCIPRDWVYTLQAGDRIHLYGKRSRFGISISHMRVVLPQVNYGRPSNHPE
jgi:hypothetical protein